jgi:hypothetical protein
MSRDVAWFDSGELALVARQLGLGHPPGQPLYTWLLALFARLPFVDPLAGMNFFSALAGAACAIPADYILRRTVHVSGPTRFVVLVGAGSAAPVWDQATGIELYALATFLFLAIAALAVRIGELASRKRHWFALGGLGGALAAVNPVFALAAALATFFVVRRRVRASFAACALLGALVGLVPYVHVLLVRNATDRIVWGELSTWAGFRAYLLGADYGQKMHSAYGAVPRHIATWIGWAWSQAAVLAILGWLGWLLDPRLRHHIVLLGIALVFGFGFTTTYGNYYPHVPDFNGYLAPALWLGGLGIAGLAARVRGPGRLMAHVPAALVGVAIVATLVMGDRPVWTRNRSRVAMPRELAKEFLDSAEPGTLLLVESDHLVFPLLYLTEVEKRRGDVVVINVGWASSSWYWRHLYSRHPTLPQIPLAAPDRDTRLVRLLTAAPERPVRVEHSGLAARLRLRSCPATWGVAIATTCKSVRDDEARFLGTIGTWWTGQEASDLFAPSVIANVTSARAEALWARGDAPAALRAWRAGIGADVPLPEALPPERVPRPPLATGPVFIGSAAHNREAGALALEILGRPDLAAKWRSAAP